MPFHSFLGIAATLLLAGPAAARQIDSSPPPPRGARFVQLRHVRTYYEVYGRGRSREHLVIAPEQRGHGHTGDVPGPYHVVGWSDRGLSR